MRCTIRYCSPLCGNEYESLVEPSNRMNLYSIISPGLFSARSRKSLSLEFPETTSTSKTNFVSSRLIDVKGLGRRRAIFRSDEPKGGFFPQIASSRRGSVAEIFSNEVNPALARVWASLSPIDGSCFTMASLSNHSLYLTILLSISTFARVLP